MTIHAIPSLLMAMFAATLLLMDGKRGYKPMGRRAKIWLVVVLVLSVSNLIIYLVRA